MKGFLILAILLATAFAGTRRALPGETEKALALWKKYCENGGEGGVDGSKFIHCKHHLGQVTRNINGGTIDAEVPQEQRTQYIFVQPAPLHFNHNLVVKSGATLEPKTVIYVRPAETSHTYNPEIVPGPEIEHEKPELVFLESTKSSRSKARSEGRGRSLDQEDVEEEDAKKIVDSQSNGARISASIGSSSSAVTSSSSSSVTAITFEETGLDKVLTSLDKVIKPSSKITSTATGGTTDADSKPRQARGIMPKVAYSKPYSMVYVHSALPKA